MPAPLSGITTLGVDELFESVILPEMLPTVIVLMSAMIVVACPAVSVIGPETPTTEKPAPATEMFEIVRTPEPTLVIDTAWPTFCPRPTPPKLTAVGWMEIEGCPELVPVPDSAIVETAGFVFAVMEMLPVTAPAVVGANLATNEVPWPGFTVIGSVNPFTEKPDPEAASCVMVSVAAPVFVTVNVCVADDPVPTLPNKPVAPATATVVAVVGSAGAVAFALVKPVQPT